jgi:hypothetical protein
MSAPQTVGWDPSTHAIGDVDNLGCPMLAKIGEAFAYAQLANRKGPNALGKGSRTFQGTSRAPVISSTQGKDGEMATRPKNMW